MVHRDAVLAHLEQLYTDIRRDRDKVSTIQNWCVTVWVAALAAAASPQLQFNQSQRLLLPLLPVGLFWLLASLQHTFIVLATERAIRLEKHLLAGDLETLRPEDTALLLSYSKTSAARKWRALLQALFTCETVLSFFVLLAAATLLLHLVDQ